MGVITRNNIVTNGLVLALDAKNPLSLTSGSTDWFDLTRTITSGSLRNSASYSSENGGTVFFAITSSINTYSKVQLTSSTYNEWTTTAIVKPYLSNAKSGQGIVSTIPATGGNSAGYIGTAFTLFYNTSTIAIDNSGSIYVGGQFGGYQSTVRSFVVKMNNSGALDTTFNFGITPGGVYTVTPGGIIFDSSGSMYTTGTNLGGLGISKNNRVSGSFISSPPYAAGGNSGISTGITLLDESTNSLYVCGISALNYQNSASGYFVKMNANDYSRNFTFDTISGFNSTSATYMALDASKNIYVVGGFTTYKGVAASRIVKVNGVTAAIDISFNYGTGFNNTANFVIIQSDSKPLIGGSFTNYSGSAANRLVRLNTDGTVDNTYNTGVGFNNTVASGKLQSDGKLVAVGLFTSYSGSTVNRIVRLNTNGTIDNTFNIGTGFNTNSVTDLVIQPDGKILVLSDIATSYSGSSFNNIVRLNTDGTVDTTFSAGTGIDLPLYRENTECVLAGNTYQFIGTGLFSNNGNRLLVSQLNPFWANKYHHLTITFGSDKNFRFYYNGVLRNTVAASSGLVLPLQISEIYANENSYMGLYHVYNRALTQAEILLNYNATKTRFGLT
jgi:uncharacterized delta-60 repeat protein